MSAAKADVGDLVLDALEKALQQAGDCRLITSGARNKGLLPGGTLTAAKKQAKEHCLDRALGLFTIREVDESKGKSVAKVPFVTITRRGIELLFERRTPAQRHELLTRCANPYKEAAHDALLHVTAEELKQVVAQRESLDHRATQLRKSVRQIVDDELAALDRGREALDRQREELERLTSERGEPDRVQTSPLDVKRASLSKPVSDGEMDFQRDLCRQLVFAWQDHPTPEARAALEGAMLNSGLEQVGRIGETVSFDNREHRTTSDLLPGQAAVIVETGWQLVSPRGTLLIAPPQVASAANPARADHAAKANA